MNKNHIILEIFMLIIAAPSLEAKTLCECVFSAMTITLCTDNCPEFCSDLGTC